MENMDPKGVLDTSRWTEDVRKMGAGALRTIKREEEKAFEAPSRIAWRSECGMVENNQFNHL